MVRLPLSKPGDRVCGGFHLTGLNLPFTGGGNFEQRHGLLCLREAGNFLQRHLGFAVLHDDSWLSLAVRT